MPEHRELLLIEPLCQQPDALQFRIHIRITLLQQRTQRRDVAVDRVELAAVHEQPRDVMKMIPPFLQLVISGECCLCITCRKRGGDLLCERGIFSALVPDHAQGNDGKHRQRDQDRDACQKPAHARALLSCVTR